MMLLLHGLKLTQGTIGTKWLISWLLRQVTYNQRGAGIKSPRTLHPLRHKPTLRTSLTLSAREVSNAVSAGDN